MTSDSWVLPEELRALAEGGDDDLVKEVLSVFQSDTAERLHAMRATTDREELRKQAHALKGSSGQVGAIGLSKICQTLETNARAAQPDELQKLVAEIESEFAIVKKQMMGHE
jgi:histidine phosphotransfer protein HptB